MQKRLAAPSGRAPDARGARGARGRRADPARAERFDRPSSTPSLRGTRTPRARARAPGMHAGHDLLLAVIMAIAMTATLFLYTR